jgi:hypothetical protein
MNFDGSKRSVSPGRFLFIHQKNKKLLFALHLFAMAKANKIIILTAPSGRRQDFHHEAFNTGISSTRIFNFCCNKTGTR